MEIKKIECLRISPSGKTIYYKDKIRVEIRKETVSHNSPHMHITHSDKTDVSIDLNTLNVLSGSIKSRILKKMKKLIYPYKEELLNIWDSLNEYDDIAFAERLIKKLPWSICSVSYGSIYLKNTNFR